MNAPALDGRPPGPTGTGPGRQGLDQDQQRALARVATLIARLMGATGSLAGQTRVR